MTTHEIHCGDSLAYMKQQPDKRFSCVVTSPPYEDARTYGIDYRIKGMKWVEWCIPRVVEMCRVTNGLVFFNAAGRVRQWKYTPVIEWLVADLTRDHGIVCGPAPYVFHRIGIPGSGSKHYHRRDWEPVYAFAMVDSLPPKWSANTAMGRPPKYGPGGEMSHRLADGSRRDQWGGTGHASSGTGRKTSGEHKANGRPSHKFMSMTSRGKHRERKIGGGRKMLDLVEADGAEPKVADALANGMPQGGKLHTKNNGDKMRVQCYTPPPLANPGNVIHCKVGGGLMGSPLAHENEAPFPERLVEFFIRSYCPPSGEVLDPFGGSGTVAAVAKRTGRNSVSCDIRESQCDIIRRRLATVQPELF